MLLMKSQAKDVRLFCNITMHTSYVYLLPSLNKHKTLESTIVSIDLFFESVTNGNGTFFSRLLGDIFLQYV